MQENKDAGATCFILLRMDSKHGHYYQTNASIRGNLTPKTRQAVANQAAWIMISRIDGQLSVRKCDCPRAWWQHTLTKLQLTPEEYERIKDKLLRSLLIKSGEFVHSSWLCAGDKYQDDWVRICRLLVFDHLTVDKAVVRAKLIALAKGDESKCRHYGGPTEPDKVMFSREWLEKLGAALRRKRESKKQAT